MTIRKSAINVGLAAGVMGLLLSGVAYAATPTFSLVNLGGGSVQINVNGDPNSAVMFYYNVGTTTGLQVTTLGSTNSSGAFSTTINGSSYNISEGNSVYVIVNGQQAGLQAWPITTTSGNPILSQTSVTIGLGQTATVTSENGASVYLLSNSNPTIASVNVNGTQITITGGGLGNTIAGICFVGTASSCTNLSVNVQVASVSSLSFSTNNLSVATGGSQAVTIYGGNGVYNVSSNANTNIASANLSGNTITLYGISSGTDTITVCDQSGNCGVITVNSGSSNGSQAVNFGVTNPTISVGQNYNIGLSGGSSYFVSSNTNTNIVQATVNGATLSLYGANAGSDSITICVSNGGCNTLYVTVSAGTTVTTPTTSVTNTALLSQIQTVQNTVAQLLTQVQTIENQLAQLATLANSGTTVTTNTGSTTPTTTTYDFTELLTEGSQDAQVTALQERLTTLGFYSGPVTGFYGTLTADAVSRYQTAHGIEAVGYVGPSTRAALNAGE